MLVRHTFLAGVAAVVTMTAPAIAQNIRAASCAT